MAEAADNKSTSTAAARRWLRSGVAGVLVAGPLVGGLLVPPAQAAPAQGAQSPAADSARASAAKPAARDDRKGTGSRTATVTIGTLSPATPEKGDTVNVTGTVSNEGRASITDGRIGLRVGPSAESRGALAQNAARKEYLPGADGTEVKDEDATAKIGSMRPGIRRSFSLKVPVSALKLDDSGVYQLAVTLTGRTRERPYDQILGIERSFLPWQTSDAENKTGLTYLWPLMSKPRMTARMESDEEQTPVFRDDTLAKELAPGGRLQQLVKLGEDLPITWVVDPDLLATVNAMTEPYRVRKKGGGTRAGKGQAYAKQWLMDLQGAVKGEEIAALPFGDPDVASLAHRGRDVPGALSRLRSATDRASGTVESILHTKPSTDYAWPVDGAVDPSIVDVATSAGAHNVIARSDSIRDTALSYTPSSARPVGGGNTALVADTDLSRAFEGDLTKPGATSKAVQRFLAETHTLTAQVPSKQRDVLVAPQRMPTAAQARAMALALGSLQKDGRWVQGADLSETAKAKPDPRANRRIPSGRRYPSALRRQELPTEAYRKIQETARGVGDFKEILTRDDRVVTPFGSSMERAESTSWRGDAEGAENYRNGTSDYLVSLTKKVSLVQKSPITLSGRSATIPVTVQNNLVQGVDGLELRLKSRRRIGLDVGEAQPVKVDGGHSQSVKFSTTAKANGPAFVEAQLYTEDGKPYGKPMVFRVNVTSITSTVLLVIAGGVLLVVLAGGRMYVTRKRNGRPAESDDGSGAPGGPGDGTDGPDDGGSGGAPGSGGDGGSRDDSGDDAGDGGDTEDRAAEDRTAEDRTADDASDAAGSHGEDAGSSDADRPGEGGSRPGATAEEQPPAAPAGGHDTGRGSGSPSGTGEKVDR